MNGRPYKLRELELEQMLVGFDARCCGAPSRASLLTRHWHGHAYRVELTVSCSNCGHGHVAVFLDVAIVDVPRNT